VAALSPDFSKIFLLSPSLSLSLSIAFSGRLGVIQFIIMKEKYFSLSLGPSAAQLAAGRRGGGPGAVVSLVDTRRRRDPISCRLLIGQTRRAAVAGRMDWVHRSRVEVPWRRARESGPDGKLGRWGDQDQLAFGFSTQPTATLASSSG
jgi:hypothetical protein